MSPNNKQQACLRSSSDKMTVPIHSYYRKLAQEIDDAEWMGDDETADSLRPYADEAAELIALGHTRYALC
jgi:hypothetical protein